MESYRKALAYWPGSIHFASAQGGLWTKAHAYEEAAAVFSEQHDFSRNLSWLLCILGNTYIQVSFLDFKDVLFAGVLKEVPMNGKARIDFATSLIALELSKEAIVTLRRPIQSHENASEAIGSS